MQISLNEKEIHEAIEKEVRSVLTIADGKVVSVNLRPTRGEGGWTAEIEIQDPAPVVTATKRQSLGAVEKTKPKAAAAPVAAPAPAPVQAAAETAVQNDGEAQSGTEAASGTTVQASETTGEAPFDGAKVVDDQAQAEVVEQQAQEQGQAGAETAEKDSKGDDKPKSLFGNLRRQTNG